MRRHFLTLTLGLIAALVVGGAVAPAGAHSPQLQTDAPNGNQTTSTGPDKALIQVGPYVQVRDYHYQDGTFIVTLHANTTQLITIADVMGPVQDKGASTVPNKRIVLDPGTTTVEMEVGSYRNSAAVSIGTSNGAVYLSTGISPPNPFVAVGATAGWFGGAGTVVLMGGLALRKVRGEEIAAPKPMGDD